MMGCNFQDFFQPPLESAISIGSLVFEKVHDPKTLYSKP
jgi:hypothetical protein